MKNSIKLFAVGALLILSSCSKDFVKQERPLVTNPSDVYASAENIENALRGCYSRFKGAFMGGKMYAVFDSRGEDILNVSNFQTLQQTYQMGVTNVSSENSSFWSTAYYIINTCNLFIDDMAENETAEVVGQTLYDQYVAEAKFLRAYTYYVLCQLYSQPYSLNPQAKAVPLRLTGLAESGHNDCPRSTIGEIYETILTDLTPNALPSAPGTYEGTTRASKAAAQMLRMRVYMAMEQWSNAIAEGEAITGYELASDITSLYGVDTYNNKEMIFVLPMTLQETPNTQLGLVEYYSVQHDVCTIDTDAGILAVDGYNSEWDDRIYQLTAENAGKLYTLKYSDSNKLDWVPQMRYAETMLNLAECYVNTPGNEAKAKDMLKQIRDRAYSEGGDELDIDALPGTALREAVYNERRLELLAEGVRGIDIIRRGENFVKGGTAASPFSCDIAPSSPYYTWPIPQIEVAYNRAIND